MRSHFKTWILLLGISALVLWPGSHRHAAAADGVVIGETDSDFVAPSPYFPYSASEAWESDFEHAKAVNEAGVKASSRGNHREALRLFYIARDMGYPAAATNIGACHQNGWGVPQSYYEAARWYYEAALSGHDTGQYYLDNLVNAALAPPPPYPASTPRSPSPGTSSPLPPSAYAALCR